LGGNTLTALSRPLAVKPAYLQALAIAKTMKPSAEAIWVKTQFKRSWPAGIDDTHLMTFQ
jgi:hypothetical protein